MPAQTPSEPLSAVALARSNLVDKRVGTEKTTLACRRALHVVVAWQDISSVGIALHASQV